MKICSSPWTTVSVNSFGNVFSCLCPEWTNNKTLGNLHFQSLEEIYTNSLALIELRQSIETNNYTYCNSNICPVPMSINTHPYAIDKSTLCRQKLPSVIMLSLDYNCNLKCPSCRNERIFSKNLDPGVSFVLNSLSNSYKKYTHKCQVFCDGSGDVFASLAYQNFLFGEDLPECFSFMITTNGNLITKNLDKIIKIKNQVEGFVVSLDASTEQTYKKVRGGDFNIVLNGVKSLVDAGIKVYLQFVLQQDNYKELLQYKQIANDLNIGYGVQMIRRWDHMSDQQWKNSDIFSNPAIDLENLQQCLKVLDQDITCNLDGGILTLIKSNLSAQKG